MVDSPISPEGDGLFDLFGDSGFNDLVAPTNDVSSGNLPSRRDLRGGKPAGKSRGRTQPPHVPVRSYAEQFPQAKTVVVVRPAPKQKKKNKLSGLLTMLAVGGLFASFALPAYAFGTGAGADAANTPKNADAVAGNSITVSEKVAAPVTTRSDFSATTTAALKRQNSTAMMAANYAAYMASGARQMGDDYPWFSELTRDQGGGLSPLRYYYRECVDFVAWRLNRDAGSFTSPFKWNWSTLTPSGGNGYQWKYAWQQHGWAIGHTPGVGWVAWFGTHVAYVKSVNGDGTITIEEYNWSFQHKYGQRTLPISSVPWFLSPPPK